jgi:hypothetical protein
MTPHECLAVIHRHLRGELSQAQAAEVLAVEPLGFNLSLVELSESDRKKVADLFHATFMLVAIRSNEGGAA